MPNKEALKKKLSAMVAKKPEAEKSLEVGKRFEDDEAQLLVYDQALRAALRSKNPEAFDQYLNTISNTRKSQLVQMTDLMSRHQDASKKQGAMTQTWNKEGYSVPVPDTYKDYLSEGEMKAVLGEKAYNHFQQLRKRPSSAAYLKSAVDARTDYSKYEPIDLNVQKTLTGADGYVGKAKPIERITRPVTSVMIARN